MAGCESTVHFLSFFTFHLNPHALSTDSPRPFLNSSEDEDDALSYFAKLAEEWFENRFLITKKR